MSQLLQIGQTATAQVDRLAFGNVACEEHGVVVLRGADSWGAHERGFVELPTAHGSRRVPIAYDERDAPFVLRTDGSEDRGLLLSLSDEDDFLACAWARVDAGAALVGVGVDLCAAERLRPRTSGRDFSLLLFTEEERAREAELAEDPYLARATLFAAKEAGFKACAAPLRRWYETHDEQLLFEVRHFVMEQPGVERGTGRNQAAQRAMERMGIERVQVHHVALEGMALVVAVALGRPKEGAPFETHDPTRD